MIETCCHTGVVAETGRFVYPFVAHITVVPKQQRQVRDSCSFADLSRHEKVDMSAGSDCPLSHVARKEDCLAPDLKFSGSCEREH